MNSSIDGDTPGRQPVLYAAGRTYYIDDVLANAARIYPERGTQAQHPNPTQSRSCAEQVDDAALDDLISEFRYQHDLVSAAECEDWLGLRGLCYADLHASISRRLRGTLAADLNDAQIDAILSDDFACAAHDLAARVALAIENATPTPLPDSPLGPFWSSWDEQFDQLQQNVRQQPQWIQMLRRLQRPLTLIEFDCVEFDSLDAANEARLCVAMDGETLIAIAHSYGFASQRHRARRQQIDERWLEALDLTNGDKLAPAICEQTRYLLLQPHSTQAPCRSEPEVAKQIDEILLRQHLEPLVARHVRWAFPVERR